MTFAQFKETRRYCRNLATTELGDVIGLPDGTPGYLYADGTLFITTDNDDPNGNAVVDLFGGEYSGTLGDCEAELWHAALVNDCI